MAVTEQFRQQWLECYEEFGKNIEQGDIEVMTVDEVDETVSLPAVKFQQAYDYDNPKANVPEGYRHVPMTTFMKPIQEALAEATQGVNEVITDIQTYKDAAQEAADSANSAATAANSAASAANTAKSTIEANESSRISAENARVAAENSRQSAWSTWFSDTKSAWSTWFSDTKSAWTTWINGKASEWTTWLNARKAEWKTFYTDGAAVDWPALKSAAETATAAAEKVNATLSGSTITVVSRTGATSTANLKGDKGDKGDDLTYSSMTAAEKSDLAEQVLQKVVTDNILGPTYNAASRSIVYSISSAATYNAASRSISLG